MTGETAHSAAEERSVLVTGGAGLIGTAVRRHLSGLGLRVAAIDITDFGRDEPDLTIMGFDDMAGLDELIASHEIDSIIHCGAISGPMMAQGDPLRIIETNIDGTARMLDLARRHGLRRFVFSSSVSVYGSVGAGVIDEATACHPTSVYGASKVACESLLEGFAVEYGVDSVALRIGRVYGPFRRANCILGDIIRDASTGTETIIPCDPEFAYHYVYVDDVAEAIAAVLLAPQTFGGRVYNVGGGEALTMPEIAKVAQRGIAGASVRLVPGADDVPDVQRAFDISRIAREVGWAPRFPLELGLRAYRASMAREPVSMPG